MFDIDFTFLWTAVNLAVIYFFVNKFLFKRLGAFMDKRAAGIAADIDKAKAARQEGEEYRRQYRDLIDDALTKHREILDEANQKAVKEYESILDTAAEEAAHITHEARQEIDLQRKKLYMELQKDISSLAISAASKVIESNMDNAKNRELVEQFLSKEGAA